MNIIKKFPKNYRENRILNNYDFGLEDMRKANARRLKFVIILCAIGFLLQIISVVLRLMSN